MRQSENWRIDFSFNQEAPMTFNRRFLYAALTSTLALLFHANAPAQSVDRSKTIKEIASLKKQFIEKEKRFLSPSAEDQAAFAEFLKRPNTGMIRLFPGGLYQDVLLTGGGGSLYSFARLTHESRGGSDIGLRPVPKNDFATTPIAEYVLQPALAGFIVSLGDVPLDEVTLEHDGVKFLASYDAPSTLPERRAEVQRARDGVGKNGYEYKRYAPAIVNHTYALRSIVYDRSDVLVAFRVVRKEIDGSVVILWKTLKRFPTPPLLR
jgi:hypothetical protein